MRLGRQPRYWQPHTASLPPPQQVPSRLDQVPPGDSSTKFLHWATPTLHVTTWEGRTKVRGLRSLLRGAHWVTAWSGQ